MNNGYIALHRKIYDSYLSSSPYRVALWVYLLVSANHKDKRFLFNGNPIDVHRGEFITSTYKISANTGISKSYVNKLLDEFEKESMIVQQVSTKSRVIKVVKYNDYQDCGHREDTERTPRVLNNNDNNVINNIYIGAKFIPPLLTDLSAYIKDKGYSVDPDKFVAYYESKGWMIGKNKMKDWKAAVRTWHLRNKPEKQTVDDYMKGKKLL